MTMGAEVISALLTVNGVLIAILLKQIGNLNVNLEKLWDALKTKVDDKTCDGYRELCFKTCPERHRRGEA